MTDQQLWSAAAERIKVDYNALSPALKQRLSELSAEVMRLKSSHQLSASSSDTERVCTECKGLCCRFGKHHFTVVELIVFLSSGQELFTPDFNNPVCPYHGNLGCLMQPSLRPFNCIIFICEELEGGLDMHAREELASIERRLREIYQTFDQLLGNRFANGLLITYQRTLDSGSPLLNS